MSNPNEEEKQELTMDDFKFLDFKSLGKLEIRFNQNTTANKIFAKISFKVDPKRDDTFVSFETSASSFKELLEKIHDWYNNYLSAIKSFDFITKAGQSKNASEGPTTNSGMSMGA